MCNDNTFLHLFANIADFAKMPRLSAAFFQFALKEDRAH